MVELQPETVYFRSNGIPYSRTQLPIQNAFALTIHKTQGLSLRRICLALDSTIFSVGQAYTALSRASKLEDVSITDFDIAAVKVDEEARLEYQRLEKLVS